MTYPKLSIIIPCYNNGTLLAEMIECVRRQTFEDWELVIVDDQSTDNTPSIVRAYEQADERIKLVCRTREPKGSTTCRNIGFDNSRGEYIIHFDADDLISDTCIENRVKFVDENPDVDYASFPAMTFTNSDKLPVFSDKGKKYGAEKNGIDLLKRFLSADYPFSTWNNIYRKTVIADIRWDEEVKIYTDFSYIVPGILSGLKHKFSEQQEVDYYYRTNQPTGSMCSTFVSQEKCNSTIYLFSKTLGLLSVRSDFKKRKKEFLKYIILHFERLILDADVSKIEEYLSFVRKYYSDWHTNSLLLISILAQNLKNRRVRRILVYFIFALRFGYTNYLTIIFTQACIVIKKEILRKLPLCKSASITYVKNCFCKK